MRSERISGQECGNRQKLIFCISLIILLVWPAASNGKDESTTRFISQDQGRALTITSSRMTLNNQTNTIVFEGDVTISQEAMTLKADVVDVAFNPTSEGKDGLIGGAERKRSLSTITATGDIRFIQGVRTVYASKVVYYKQDEKMVFTGSPNIKEGRDELKGERITVYILEDRVVVEGGEAIIHPK